jgi:beta-lactamase regulating signal transducer with metallopeptidase domain
MPALFLYLLKLSISLSVTWLFYRFILRGLTFYRLNRWYLLGYTLLSFLIPFINIGPIAADADQVHQPLYIQLIPVVGNYTPLSAPQVPATPNLSPWNLAGLALIIGIGVLLIRTFLWGYSLARIKKQARLLSSDEGIRIYEVDRPIPPFSFGKSIYINPRLHTEKEWTEIILHEYVHIRQHHTLDILLTEVVTILNWYNPFAWALRHSIRQNLEFIADQQVLDKGVDKKEYQYHLLNVMDHPGYRLANNFNFSSLKKRIIMMNKIRSARLHLLRFLFLLPLLAVILLAFRGSYPKFSGHNGPVFVNAAGIVIALPEKTPLQGVTVREKRTGLQTTTDKNGFYKLQIPATTDSVRVQFEYTKKGYKESSGGGFYPSLKQTTGLIDVAVLEESSYVPKSMFMVAPNFSGSPDPVDPGYSDALNELHRVLSENEQLNKFQAAKKNHPDVSLYYVTEDKKKHLVIHTDGSVEKFGYPGTPDFTEMEKKYGPLPWYLTDNTHPVGQGYLDHWAAISAQAEKEFHPAGGNPKAIIFPGDSRVIAVDATGKAAVYDMDNTVDPKERRGFEQLYGKLPACVPENGTVSPAISIRSQKPAQSPDTTPATQTIDTLLRHANVSIDAGFRPNPIVIVDGIRMSDSPNAIKQLNPEQIASIQVLKAQAATTQYGPEASARGVLLISLKKAQKQP